MMSILCDGWRMSDKRLARFCIMFMPLSPSGIRLCHMLERYVSACRFDRDMA